MPNLQAGDAIIQFIKSDEWMMKILKSVKSLNLPDFWVCAGFIRSKVWDTLHNFETQTPLQDVDVVCFDASNLDSNKEINIETKLRQINPDIPWSVKNLMQNTKTTSH